jgi:hypothetical protein
MGKVNKIRILKIQNFKFLELTTICYLSIFPIKTTFKSTNKVLIKGTSG